MSGFMKALFNLGYFQLGWWICLSLSAAALFFFLFALKRLQDRRNLRLLGTFHELFGTMKIPRIEVNVFLLYVIREDQYPLLQFRLILDKVALSRAAFSL